MELEEAIKQLDTQIGISQDRLESVKMTTLNSLNRGTANSACVTTDLINYGGWDGSQVSPPFWDPNQVYPGSGQYPQQPYQQPYDYQKILEQQKQADYERQKNYEHLKNLLAGNTTPKKSEFETIIDALFTYQDKIDYLLTVGYVYRDNIVYKKTSGADSNGIPYTVDIGDPIDIAFLREISIKFKNLLLAKPIKTIKI